MREKEFGTGDGSGNKQGKKRHIKQIVGDVGGAVSRIDSVDAAIRLIKMLDMDNG